MKIFNCHNEMSSAFSISTRSTEDHIDVRPPERHIVPYITGGLKTLIHRVKTKDLPRQPAPGYFTNKDGHFELKGPCIIGGRFNVIKVLDTNGQSAVLVLAEDEFDQEKLVVIKVLHSQFYQIGVQESHILTRLAAIDPLNISHTLRLLTTVMCESHFCLVFEPLLPDPLTTVFSELPQHKVLPNIKKVGLRLLASIGFLHHHNMIHTDLKPENLLLRDEHDLDSVHIVDFGNTLQYVHSELSLYYKDFELQTPLYRAPEVLFGVPFGTEIDMWSLGCILAELYLGEALFFGYTIIDIISKMKSVLGPFPGKLFRKGKYYRKYKEFTEDLDPSNNTLRLMECLQCKDVQFADLLAGLLQFDPSERLTASEAACHPFFASHFPMAFLVPNSKDNVKDTTNGMCPQSCPSSPFIARDVSRRQPTNLELLRLGTRELPDMNETYILKPSPKVGTVKRKSTDESTSGTQESSDEELNTSRDVCLPGPSDISVVRNLVQGRNKGGFSRSVKEKMSDLLKAIKDEQDLVEVDLDRRDKTQQQYDRYCDETRIKTCTDTRDIVSGFVSPKLKRTNRPNLIQPSPKYGKVRNENELIEKNEYDTETARLKHVQEKERYQEKIISKNYLPGVKRTSEIIEPETGQEFCKPMHNMLHKPYPVYKNEKVKKTSSKYSSELNDKIVDKHHKISPRHRSTNMSPSQLTGIKSDDVDREVKSELQSRYLTNYKKRSKGDRSSEMEYHRTRLECGSFDEPVYSVNQLGLSSGQHLTANNTYGIKDRNISAFEESECMSNNYKSEDDNDVRNKDLSKCRNTVRNVLQAKADKAYNVSSTSDQYRTDVKGGQSGRNNQRKDLYRHRSEKPSSLNETNMSSDGDSSGEEGEAWFDNTLKYDSVTSSRNRSKDLNRHDDILGNSERKRKSKPLAPGNHMPQHKSTSSNSTVTYAESQSSEEHIEIMSPGLVKEVQHDLKPKSSRKLLNSAVLARNRNIYDQKRSAEQQFCSPKHSTNQADRDQLKQGLLPGTSQGMKDLKRHTKDVNSSHTREEFRYNYELKERDRKRNTKRKLEIPSELETENTYIIHKASQGKKQKPLSNETMYGMRNSNPFKEDDLMVVKNRKPNQNWNLNSLCKQKKNLSTISQSRDQNVEQSKHKSHDTIRQHSRDERQ